MSLFGGVGLPDRPDPANIQKLDLLPLPMISRMMRFGMRIDPEHFRALSAKLNARMDDLRCEIVNEIPPESLDRFIGILDERDAAADDADFVADVVRPEFNAQSTQDVAELLYDILHLDQTRGVKIKKTKAGKLSTGKKTLEQLKREHPIVPLILEYREASKLDGTYARAMPRRARLHPKGADCPRCGRHHYTDELRVHAKILTTRTATGRTAHKEPNLANIPVRTKLGREIRAGFIASEGYVICDRDLSQIELRILADRSGDPEMIQVYIDGGDIHNRTACGAFGLTIEELDPVIHRIPSKTANFSIVYGTTEMGLYEQLCTSFALIGRSHPEWLTESWCAWFIKQWFVLYRRAKIYLDDLESIARRLAITWTLCGRVRRIPEVRSCHPYIQEAGVRQAANHPIQGTSADIMKLIMGEADSRFREMASYGITTYPLNTIYDALMIETPEDDGPAVDAALEEIMDNVFMDKQTGQSHCKVPIRSDGKILKRWTKE